jgi:lysophospholipase L1-like esterase
MTPRGRRRLFWAATLATPVVLLVLVEGTLRAVGAGAPEPLLLDVPNTGGAFVRFNPLVARRYFDPAQTTVPALTPETFARVKGEGTVRVLCLGESTTAGFPFECQVPFPKQLRERLARAAPDRRIEVFNAGIAAIGSAVVLDLLPELLDATSPDAVVVYLGHNEFYGIYGSASAVATGGNATATRWVLALQRLRIVAVLRDLLRAVRPAPAGQAAHRSLMESVVRDQHIPLGSAQVAATAESFRDNLVRIVDECRSHKAAVLLGTLVSNERDLPPFRGAGAAEAVTRILAAGDSALAAGDQHRADSCYRLAFGADSAQADVWFALGRAAWARGDSAGAAQRFAGARDRDAMRFRAPGSWNDVLRAVAREREVMLVDLEATFRAASPAGVLGNELFCDHLHPNPRGYALMAETFAEAVDRLHLLSRPSVGNGAEPLGVTDLDWDIGLLKVFDMMQRWPFRAAPASRGSYVPHGDSVAARIAYDYLHVHNVWSRAHNVMAEEFLRRGDLPNARREYEAIAVFSPDDPWPHQKIAATYEREERWLERAGALREAIRRSPAKGLLAYQMALSAWKGGRMEEAIRAMEAASFAPELTSSERRNARFFLAGFLSDRGERDRARTILKAILVDAPDYAPARQFLARLER